ncbi:glycosyltransferase family 2 protein [Gluconobacter wancherniae]|uniref:glycosyltransferase family 2 protein n=1 Tax=Gluconobacter wancherniae TaxID=1307955 RepID=UPI001B8BB60D|nr:glycosyltransferase family 2 protein [Gluconobacter wancherniae]MBS1062289.1 glycosyltransferase family 2 protein [Gluconobacter wancherniae]
MTSTPDISVIVTIHNEWQYLPRTLLSISEAATDACHAGLSVECVFVLDSSEEKTRNIIKQKKLNGVDEIQIIEVDYQSVSLSRNHGIIQSKGDYIFILDADDLISFSILRKLYCSAINSPIKTIFTPRFKFGFDLSYFIVEYFSSDLINIGDMVCQNLYNARLFSHRSFFENNPYFDMPFQSGYAFEDWLIATEALASGYRFQAVDETAWYYRVRKHSLFQQSIKKTTRQIPKSKFFDYNTFLENYEITRKITHSPKSIGIEVLNNSFQMTLMKRANRIDPAIIPYNFYNYSTGEFSNATSGITGHAYAKICRIENNKNFSDIFFLSPIHFPYDFFDDFFSKNKSTKVAFFIIGDELNFENIHRHYPDITIINFEKIMPGIENKNRDIIIIKTLQNQSTTTKLHFFPTEFSYKIYEKFHIIFNNQCFYYSLRNLSYHEKLRELEFLNTLGSTWHENLKQQKETKTTMRILLSNAPPLASRE